jgi:hypothetical protein
MVKLATDAKDAVRERESKILLIAAAAYDVLRG